MLLGSDLCEHRLARVRSRVALVRARRCRVDCRRAQLRRQLQVVVDLPVAGDPERIDELLERKKALAASVVGQGEAWITELGDEELRELVALNADDVEDDEELEMSEALS